MSAETITTLAAMATILVALLSGFAWLVKRMDARIDLVEDRVSTRIDGLDEKLSSRIDRVDEKLSTRIDRVDEKLSTRIDRVDLRIDGLAHEVSELKAAVARLEGPPRRLELRG